VVDFPRSTGAAKMMWMSLFVFQFYFDFVVIFMTPVLWQQTVAEKA
jgi:hypothetical protein